MAERVVTAAQRLAVGRGVEPDLDLYAAGKADGRSAAAADIRAAIDRLARKMTGKSRSARRTSAMIVIGLAEAARIADRDDRGIDGQD